jgi:CHASE2 domain-containing sensor protein
VFRVSLWLPAAVALTFLVFLKLDPFGLHSASEARSQQATLRIVAPFYSPSRQVVAVLIDDDYLRERQVGWPLRYADQGRLLRQIASVNPAVVLVDLVYPHGHADSAGSAPDDIAQLTRPILSSPVPIVFTALAKEPASLPADFSFCPDEQSRRSLDLLDPESMPPSLVSLARSDARFQIGYVRWAGCADRYPLLLGGDSTAPTPAFAAYRAFCATKAGAARCADHNVTEHAGAYVHPLIIRAGAFPPAEQVFAYDQHVCQKAAPANGSVPLWRRLAKSFQQLALSVFEDPRRESNVEVSLPCPAVTVIPLSLLQHASRAEWVELLQDKAVVLGASLSGMPDFVDSPVHGQVPGAVWHAMALDNLVSLGDRYLAERYELARGIAEIVIVLLLAYAFPYVLSVLDHRRSKTSRAYASFGLWILLALVFLAHGNFAAAVTCVAIGIGLDLTLPTTSASHLLCVALAGLLSAFFLSRGWPPNNWLGLVLVAFAFAHTLKAYYRPAEKKYFPAHESVLGHLYALAARRVRRLPSLTHASLSGE